MVCRGPGAKRKGMAWGSARTRARRSCVTIAAGVCPAHNGRMATKLLSGLDILVVEDEALLRKQIGAELEALGAEATGVGTLQAARQALAELAFDFAMLDISLTDGRGTVLLQEKAFSPNTGVIVMTADGGVPSVVECMRLGALDYLVKPFDPAELPLVIARARRTRQSARLEEHRRESEGPRGCSSADPWRSWKVGCGESWRSTAGCRNGCRQC